MSPERVVPRRIVVAPTRQPVTRKRVALAAVAFALIPGFMGCGSDATGNSDAVATTIAIKAAQGSLVGQPPMPTEIAVPAESEPVSVPAAPPGSESTPTSAAAIAVDGDPCRLLTADEAAAALDRELAPPRITQLTPDLSLCDYYSSHPEAGPASIHAAVLSEGIPKALWQQAQEADGLHLADGVGELAYFDGDAHLEIYAAGTWIQIQMINSARPPAELESILTEVGRNAVSRL